jgi:histone H3/H4/predicted DNA-binding WGR domain protein
MQGPFVVGASFASEDLPYLLWARQKFGINDGMLMNAPHAIARSGGAMWCAWQDVWLDGLVQLRNRDVFVISNSEKFRQKFEDREKYSSREVCDADCFDPCYKLGAGEQAHSILDWERRHLQRVAATNNLHIVHLQTSWDNPRKAKLPDWYVGEGAEKKRGLPAVLGATNEPPDAAARSSSRRSSIALMDNPPPHLSKATVIDDYSFSLKQVDIQSNSDRYYLGQVVRLGAKHYLLCRWGRCGFDGQSKNAEVDSLSAAVEEFQRVFKQKTGLRWAKRRTSKPKPGKYTSIDGFDAGAGVPPPPSGSDPPPSIGSKAFNFGGGTPAPAFNFGGGTVTGTSAPAFNFGVGTPAPAFNFGGGTPLPSSSPAPPGSTVQLTLQDHILRSCLPPAQAQLRTLAGDGSPAMHLHWMDSTAYNPAPQIKGVLRQVHPNMEITEGGMATIVSYVKHMCHALTMSALELAQQAVWAPKSHGCGSAFLAEFASDGGEIIYVTARCIQTAVRMVIPGELAKHAVSEGTKAITKYTSSGGHGGASRSARAGLQFEVDAVQHAFFEAACGGAEASLSVECLQHEDDYDEDDYDGKCVGQRMFSTTSAGTKSVVKTIVLSEGAPVYLAAVLEYLSAELLELGGNAARDNRNDKIVPRHLELAIRNDQELNKMTPDTQVTYYGAGVLPNIHAVLLPRRKIDLEKNKTPKSIRDVRELQTSLTQAMEAFRTTIGGTMRDVPTEQASAAMPWAAFGPEGHQLFARVRAMVPELAELEGQLTTQCAAAEEQVKKLLESPANKGQSEEVKSKHSPHAEGMETQEQEELGADLAVTKLDMAAGGATVDDFSPQALLYRSRAALKAEKPAMGDVAAAAIGLVGAWKLARRAGVVQIARVDELAALLDRVVEALLLPVLHLAQKLPQQHTPLVGEPTRTEVDASSLSRAQVLTAIRSTHGYSVWGSERGYTYSDRQRLSTAEEEEEWERQEQRPMLGRTRESLNRSERAQWQARRNTPPEHADRVKGVRSHRVWRSASSSSAWAAGSDDSEDEEDGRNSDAEEYDSDEDAQQQWEQEQQEHPKRSISTKQVFLAQNSEGLLLSKHAFQRKALALLRSLPSQEEQPQQWISAPALGALQVLAEGVLVGLLEGTNLVAIHCKFQTICPDFLSVALQFSNPKLAARVEGKVHPYLPSDSAPWEQCDEFKKQLPAASLTAASAASAAAAMPPNPPSDVASAEARVATSEPSAKDAGTTGATDGEEGEMITVKFIRLSGDTSELTVNVTETKTVADLKRAYEKAHGVTAACQILLSMDAQEGEGEAAEVTDEKELSGLGDELSLEAAHISEGTSLSLSIEEWAIEVGIWASDTKKNATLASARRSQQKYSDSSYVISSTQLGNQCNIADLEQRMEETVESLQEIRAQDEEDRQRAVDGKDDCPDDGQVFWAHRQDPETPEKKEAWDQAVVHALEQLTDSTADELVFDRPAFEMVAREIGQDYKTKLTWNEHAVTALQLCIEAHLKQILRGCNSLATLKGGLLAADVLLARELRCSEAEEEQDDMSAVDREAETFVAPKEIQLTRRLSHLRS